MELIYDSYFSCCITHRIIKYLNNIIEQDHTGISFFCEVIRTRAIIIGKDVNQ